MGKKEKTKKKDREQKRAASIIYTILSFILVLMIFIPPWLLFEKYIRSEIIFGLCLILSFVLTRKLGWDEKGLLAVLSGYLFSLSVPDVNLAPFCFVGFIPLFIALDSSEDLAHSFLYGFISAFSTIFLCLSWLKFALANLCGISEFQSLFLVIPLAVLFNLKFIILSLVYHWNRRRLKLPGLVFLPCVFAVLELFKWELYPWYMAIFLTKTPSLLQIMDITGLPGIAFFILFMNLSLYSLWRFLRREETRFPLKTLLIACAVFLTIFIYGQIRIHQIGEAEANAGESLTIAAVQPDSPLKISSRDADLKKEICDNLYKLAGEAVKKRKPDLIVFAEGSTTIGYQAGYNPEFRDVFNRIARDYDTPILFDNIHFVTGSEYFRSAVLLSPAGEIKGEYLKMKLAPFGEYIPLESVIPGLRRIFKYAKNYRTGREYTLLETKGVSFVPQICFESIHPGFTRRFVKKGGRLIINMTNDMWFGEKEAHQHLVASAFLSIENRIPLVRVTNNGFSAYISATGIPLAPPSQYNSAWTDCRKVPITRLNSFYRKFGDFFGSLCLSLLFLFITRSGKSFCG
jgi:apolipoprotein N-acyltransferase